MHFYHQQHFDVTFLLLAIHQTATAAPVSYPKLDLRLFSFFNQSISRVFSPIQVKRLSSPPSAIFSGRLSLRPISAPGIGARKALLAFRLFFLLTRTQLTVPNAHSPIREKKKELIPPPSQPPRPRSLYVSSSWRVPIALCFCSQASCPPHTITAVGRCPYLLSFTCVWGLLALFFFLYMSSALLLSLLSHLSPLSLHLHRQ